MTPGTRRLAGLLVGSAVGSPFAVAAASQGTVGLGVGALAVAVASLVGADGVFWPTALLLAARRPRWAWRQTQSVEDTLRLDESARRTLENVVRARSQAEQAPALPKRDRRRR